MSLDTPERAVGTDEFDERELAVVTGPPRLVHDVEAIVELLFTLFELLFADRVAEDEILDVVAEERQLAVDAPRPRAQREIEAEPRSEPRLGLPISKARLPGCGPKNRALRAPDCARPARGSGR